MKEDIEKLKERFSNASTEEERVAVDKEMKALANSDADLFAESLLGCIKDTNRKANEILLRQKKVTWTTVPF